MDIILELEGRRDSAILKPYLTVMLIDDMEDDIVVALV